jgi:hypothetical protein
MTLGNYYAKNWEHEADYDIDSETAFITQHREDNCTISEDEARHYFALKQHWNKLLDIRALSVPQEKTN